MTARSQLVIESLDDHRTPAFRGALRLYERVFPEKERIDRRYFAELLEEKRLGLLQPFNQQFLVARHGRRVVGLCTGSYLAVVNMGFVGYLATDPARKGARIGSRLRARLVRELRRDARAAGYPDLDGVLGEVEARNPWLRHLVRTRGALALDFPYRQPALGEATPDVPLVLYLEPVGARVRSLAAARMRTLLYAVYRRVYRVRFPLRQPAFRMMLRRLAGVSRINGVSLRRLRAARRTGLSAVARQARPGRLKPGARPRSSP